MSTTGDITIMDLTAFMLSGQAIEFNVGPNNWIEGTVAGVDAQHLHAKYKDLNGNYTSFMPIWFQLTPSYPKHHKVRIKQ